MTKRPNMSFSLQMLTKQSPWLLNAELIRQDTHLTRLKQYPFVHHEVAFLNYKFDDGVYIVTGPRQIGKSTHLKMLIEQKITEKTKENFLYFNCDLLDKKQDIVEVVETYINHFGATTARRYSLLDEITSVKDSFLAIKFLVDSGHSHNLTYILTGSNTISIKKTGEYLPGRRGKGIDFHFLPLDFKHSLQLTHPDMEINLTLSSSEKDFMTLNQIINLPKTLNDYLKTGGFPRVINEYHQKNRIDEDIFTIYRSWITSEIAKSDKKEYIAKGVLERSLLSLSSDTSYNAFAQDSGIGSHNTVYDYIDFFINAYVLSQIYHFDIHQKKINYRKNKKIYFNDPFIYAVIEAWLTGKPKQDYDYLIDPKPRSKLIENLVYLKLSHYFENIFYYKSNHEIDFVADTYFIEVKYQNKITKSDCKLLSEQQGKKIIVTKNLMKQENDILFIPIENFLLCDFL